VTCPCAHHTIPLICGRYVSPEEAFIERVWHLGRHNSNPFPRRYNVAPQQGNPEYFVPAIRLDGDGRSELVRLQWWLLPWWSKEPRIRNATFNARVETVATLASFRDPFRQRRCLIPALGWYEWQETETKMRGGNKPWHFHSATGELLHFAGLWDRWKSKESGQVIESCSIVIGPASEAVQPIHDRNPFLIPPERQEAWLDPKLNDPAKVMQLLQPAPADAVKFHRVSKRVNNARNEGPELAEPANDD
jgi:putative SOS response-associated peptidase YedK